MKLKRIMKQISAFALALVLICTLVPTAFAADRNTSKKCSLTIYKYEYNGTGATVGTGEAGQTVPTDEDHPDDDKKTAKPLAGVTFKYIKVGELASLERTGEKDTDTYKYGLVWEQTYKLTNEALAAILSKKDSTTAENGKVSIGDKLTGTKLNALLAEAIATKKDDLEALPGLTSMAKTDEAGKTQKTELAQGLYLVLETNVPHNVTSTTDPFLVSLPMAKYDAADAASANDEGTGWNYDVVVYPKNQTYTPELKKEVKEKDGTYASYVNTASGDVLTYQLTTKIPEINSTVTYLKKYEFVDTLPAGMVYEKDSSDEPKVTVKIGDTTWTSASQNAEKNAYFSIVYDVTKIYDVTKNTMTIELTDAGLAAINPAMSKKTVTITYTAKIEKVGADQALMGQTGNKNEVKLTYRRSDADSEKELEADATVYTYGMRLTKTFSDTGDGKTPEKNGDPTKVEFTVQDKAGNYIQANLNDTQTTKPGEYTVVGRVAEKLADGKDYAPTAKDNTVFSPDADGILFLKGLDEGVYTITEIKTDDGYKILQAPVTMTIRGVSDKKEEDDTITIAGTAPSADVTITANKAGKDNTTETTKTEKVTMEADDKSNNAIVPFEVVNEPADLVNFTLPQTGGLGSIVFTLLGAVVFAGAVLVLKKGKKRKGC